NLQRLWQTADCYPAQRPEFELLDDQGVDALADDKIGAQILGQLLKLPSHVYGVADNGKFHPLRRSNVADNYFPMIDRDTDSQLGQTALRPSRIQPLQFRPHGEGRANSIGRVISDAFAAGV